MSAKTIKEILAIFQQIFNTYCKKNRKGYNPVQLVKIRMPDKDEPDPFTREEIEAILDFKGQDANLAKFLIWTGSRLSEALALTWDCVDFEEKQVFINKSVDKVYHSTKTKSSKRYIDLLKPALSALKTQLKETSGHEHQQIEVIDRDNKTKKLANVKFVFKNPHTGKPRTRSDNLVRSFWKERLKEAEVRYRPPGQCRHTYASQMLSSGMDLGWVAKQMGHVSTDMLFKHYAKFIKENTPDLAAIANKKLGL